MPLSTFVIGGVPPGATKVSSVWTRFLFGISLPVGSTVMKRLPAVIAEHPLPPQLVAILERLHTHYKYLDTQIAEIDKELARQLATDDLGQRLMTIPGVGSITVSVLSAEVGDGNRLACIAFL
ncbi:hypothetical protein R8510_05268 [Ralstonia chuxiongensis]|nr:hypothetical protein R8510_05268 [Ralstonia chuxiongensis]